MSVFLYGCLLLFGKFIVYSFIGWLLEIFTTYLRTGKFVNRGFLIGPYTPMYGFCALLLVFCFKGETNLIYIFVFSSLMATTLEYITSVVMEKLFKARWWDYSNYPFNINGRVYLLYSVIFGVLGCLLIDLIDPKVTFYLSSIDPFWYSLVMSIIFFLFLFDVILSLNIMKRIKLTAECIKKDYTEEITKKVKKILYDNSKHFRRLFDAFPDVSVFNKNIKNKKK